MNGADPTIICENEDPPQRDAHDSAQNVWTDENEGGKGGTNELMFLTFHQQKWREREREREREKVNR